MNVIKCDCCKNEIKEEHKNNKFILPVRLIEEEICEFQGKELLRTNFDRGIRPTEVDICPKCQNKIAKFFNMLGYVDINMDKIELEIFDKFKESVSNINNDWTVTK